MSLPQWGILASKGSLLSHPSHDSALHPYAGASFRTAADELFASYRQSGAVKVAINQRFALKDAAKAQEALAGRQTTGATVLIP